MKKLFLLFALISFNSYSQKLYSSLGLSVSNSSNFKESSYVSLDNGLTFEKLSCGVVFGRSSLVDINKNESLKNYFYEIKTNVNLPTNKLSSYLILGYGGYFKSNKMFIEYGVGISYNINKTALSLSLSNWDGVNYLTPSITLNF